MAEMFISQFTFIKDNTLTLLNQDWTSKINIVYFTSKTVVQGD